MPDERDEGIIVEVDQHVPAENHVVACPSESHRGCGEIGLKEIHTFAVTILELEPLSVPDEASLSSFVVTDPERARLIECLPGLLDAGRVQVAGVDLPAVALKLQSTVHQVHNQRVRLFARRTSRRKHPKGPCAQDSLQRRYDLVQDEGEVVGLTKEIGLVIGNPPGQLGGLRLPCRVEAEIVVILPKRLEVEVAEPGPKPCFEDVPSG